MPPTLRSSNIEHRYPAHFTIRTRSPVDWNAWTPEQQGGVIAVAILLYLFFFALGVWFIYRQRKIKSLRHRQRHHSSLKRVNRRRSGHNQGGDRQHSNEKPHGSKLRSGREQRTRDLGGDGVEERRKTSGRKRKDKGRSSTRDKDVIKGIFKLLRSAQKEWRHRSSEKKKGKGRANTRDKDVIMSIARVLRTFHHEWRHRSKTRVKRRRKEARTKAKKGKEKQKASSRGEGSPPGSVSESMIASAGDSPREEESSTSDGPGDESKHIREHVVRGHQPSTSRELIRFVSPEHDEQRRDEQSTVD